MGKIRMIAGASIACFMLAGSLSACSSNSGDAGSSDGVLMTEMPTQADVNITSEEVEKIVSAGDNSVVIVDVRTLEEFNQGHIPGAINLDAYTATEEDIKSVLPDKTADYVVYCRTGKRATAMGSVLQEMGYSHAKVLGGIETHWNGEVVTN